jgi:hypothetical protein
MVGARPTGTAGTAGGTGTGASASAILSGAVGGQRLDWNMYFEPNPLQKAKDAASKNERGTIGRKKNEKDAKGGLEKGSDNFGTNTLCWSSV